MAATINAFSMPDARDLLVTRDFDAPRELIFELWTTADHLSRWFCPDGFTVPSCHVDFRGGGGFCICMRSPEGRDYWWRATYREIAAPDRIVFSSGLVGKDGKPCWDVLTTVRFSEIGDRTRITVEAAVEALYDPAAADDLAGMEEGWVQGLNHLAAYAAEY